MVCKQSVLQTKSLHTYTYVAMYRSNLMTVWTQVDNLTTSYV